MFNVGTTTTGALNSFTKAANSMNSTLTKAMNSALGTVNSAAASTVSAVNSAVNSAATSTISAVNSVIPSANSLRPFNSAVKNVTNSSNSSNSLASKNSAYNNFKNVFNNGYKANSANSSAGTISWGTMFGVLLFLLSIFLIAMFVFKSQFDIAWNYLIVSFRKAFNLSAPTNETPEQKEAEADSNVTTSMPTSLDTAAEANPNSSTSAKGLLNKLLPMGSKEVFNISTNDYTYYDSEPLCLALGAELATYEQVQEAWNKGGDWCNYGWTKGQLAIYPTQKDTWEKLQNGPQDQKSACGRPGVNGGYFDNPEMRFGVNCYGVKPDQSANDERLLMENGTIPKTASTLKVDQQIQDIKQNLDMIGILPFSSSKWSA
jgi:hypothetical protein